MDEDIGIINSELSEEFKEAYRIFAINVIEERAIPDIRDGFKPVQRRILYSLLEDFDSSKFHTSARVSGAINGRYHPHNDESIYQSMIRMAQPFSNLCPFVAVQGNYGSVDGDDPASKRYTGVRISKKWEPFFRQYLEVSKMVDNYDFTLKEPEVIASLVPTCLITFTQGIAVGFMTCTLPFNPREVFDGLLAILKNPAFSLEELMEIVPGPDFPLGGTILNTREELLEVFSRGRGAVHLASSYEIVTGKVPEIIFTSIPANINKSDVLREIGEKAEKFPEITEIYDESQVGSIRIRLVLTPNYSGQEEVVVKKLFKETSLKANISYINLMLRNKIPKIYPLIEVFRELVIFHKHIFLTKAEILKGRSGAELHLLEGTRRVLEDIEEFVSFVRKNDKEQVFSYLEEKYGLDRAQSDRVISLRLSQVTRMEKEKLIKEIQRQTDIYSYNDSIVSSNSFLESELSKEYVKLRDSFNIPRRTSFDSCLATKKMTELIRKSSGFLGITKEGFFHFFEFSFDQTQRRGGIGRTIFQDVSLSQLVSASTHDSVLIFTNRSRAYYQDVTNVLPLSSQKEDIRFHIQEAFEFSQDENVTFMITIPESTPLSTEIIILTNQGRVRRTSLENFISMRKKGISLGELKEGEVIVDGRLISSEREVLIATSNGRVLRCLLSDFEPLLLRSSTGVKGFSLKSNEICVSLSLVRGNTREAFCILKDGTCRRFSLDRIPLYQRGSRGVIVTRESVGVALILSFPLEATTCTLIEATGRMISFPVDQVLLSSGRVGKGVMSFRVSEGANLSLPLFCYFH